METLLSAGIAIPRSIDTLIRQQQNKRFQAVLREVGGQVRGGASLSESLASFPRIFDPLMLSMVRAGEAGGDLSAVLGRLADFREKSARIKGKVQAAAVYPAIVISVAVIIVGLLMTLVVPQFQEIFRGMLRGQPLPALTQLVINISDLVARSWVWLLIGVAAAIGALRGFHRTQTGKRWVDGALYWGPGVRSLIQRVAIARFARTFGALMRAGVPVLDCLNIAREVAGNWVVQDLLLMQHDRVRDGDSLAGTLIESKVFPPMVSSMIAVGEETGKVPEMCDRIADTYEEEIDNVVAGLTSVIEPIMIVILALVVGTVVIALFLPIVSIIQHLGGY